MEKKLKLKQTLRLFGMRWIGHYDKKKEPHTHTQTKPYHIICNTHVVRSSKEIDSNLIHFRFLIIDGNISYSALNFLQHLCIFLHQQPHNDSVPCVIAWFILGSKFFISQTNHIIIWRKNSLTSALCDA